MVCGKCDPTEVGRKFLQHLLQTDPSCPSRQFPNFLLAAQQDLWRNAPLRFFVVAEAEPQELPLDWSSHRTLCLVYFELQSTCKKASDIRHHSLPRLSAANVNVAVVRIPHEAVLTSSSSRSSSSSTMFDRRGESGPPCGVPSSAGLTSPFSITPTFKNAPINRSTLLSVTRRAIDAISLS